MPSSPPADPTRFAEAVRAFRRRVPMSDAEWDALEASQREFAFKVSGVAQADLVQDVWDAIDRAIEKGTTLADFKQEVGAALEEAWGGPDAARLETVFRTNVHSAYSAGRQAVMQTPAVREARPFWRFDAVADGRTSDICSELDGTVLPADDPFWQRHTPPLHHNCRSVVVPLAADEAEQEGVDYRAPDVEADEGFGRAYSPTEPPDWEPEPRDYAGPLQEIIRYRTE